VDLGCYENWWLPHPPNAMPPGCFLPVARLVKEHFAEHEVRSNTGLPVPVVAVGKLGYPDLAERALRGGDCDMVMLARPLLADPQWPNKAYAGRVREITPCIGCQQCLGQFQKLGHSYCAVNPRTYFEHAMPDPPTPVVQRKRVAVVGAGPAGVQCACTVAQRGHSVTLYEGGMEAGGVLHAGSVAVMKYDVANYMAHLNVRLAKTARNHDLTVRFETRATPDLLDAGGFDAVVICAGARVVRPPVSGVDLPHVVTAVELLNHPALASDAGRVVVVGGGEVGCETAHFLAYEHGKRVTVIEMLPHFMPETCAANRGYLLHYLERANVQLLNATRLMRIVEGEVVVRQNVAAGVPDPYVTWAPVVSDALPNPLAKPLPVEEETRMLPAELVVLATGMASDNTLYEACVQAHVAPLIKQIGDAFEPASILQATRAGERVARSL
jgi:2-enoate reductase